MVIIVIVAFVLVSVIVSCLLVKESCYLIMLVCLFIVVKIFSFEVVRVLATIACDIVNMPPNRKITSTRRQL